MAESIRKYVARAPRYVLRPQDRNIMRFSLEAESDGNGIEQTTLLNLSESGLAFLVESGHEPGLGDHIKVEIPIPGGEQIAWWAVVTRIETYVMRGWFYSKDLFEDEGKVLVGLRFDPLPEPHTRAMRKGLRSSFIQAMRDQQIRNSEYYRSVLASHAFKIFWYALATIIAFGIMYRLAQPGGNYDAKRGSQWGERFKF